MANFLRVIELVISISSASFRLAQEQTDRHVVIIMIYLIIIMIDELGACQNPTTSPENLSPDALYCTPSASVRVTEEARKEKHMVGTNPVTDQSCLHHEVSVP